jgi:hypothetical protein
LFLKYLFKNTDEKEMKRLLAEKEQVIAPNTYPAEK